MKKWLGLLAVTVLTAGLFLPPVCSFAVDGEPGTTAPAEEEERIGDLLGDLDGNGAVDAAEERRILRFVAQLELPTAKEIVFADLNADGKISAADARTALRTAAQLEGERRHRLHIEVEQEAVCDTPGRIFYECEDCDLWYYMPVPPPGHRYVQTEQIPPACEKKGKTVYICSVCGAVREEEIPATGHDWGDAEQTMSGRCRVCGKLRPGWTQVGEKWVYFHADGSVTKGTEIRYGELPDGRKGNWYTVDGVIDTEYRGALEADGEKWIVSGGEAKKVETEADRTLYRAHRLLASITTADMSKEKKLRKCFVYVRDAYRERRPRSPHYHGMDWPVVYANDMFVRGYGNCFSFASAFAYLAKAIGYENVYCCNSGTHGWAEINGLIYDPEQSKNHSNSTYYGKTYDFVAKTNYRAAIAPGYAWMHVKI